MLDKLEQVERRFQDVTEMLADPAVMGNREDYLRYTREHAELAPIVETFKEYQRVSRELAEAKALLEESQDSELRTMAVAEMQQLEPEQARLHQELLILLVPKDPNDQRNIILEIRAGTGGDEAGLFAAELFEAYTRYAATKNWRTEVMSASYSDVGGFKEVIARIVGRGAYSIFKYERGVHRVQRVPQTETQGRVHTSTVTVAVLPEAEEVDVEINEKDLRIDVFRSSGPGGQSVNTTDSAVRVTHLPTNIVVSCQDEKSQLKNKLKALTVLRSRLLEMKREAQESERRDDRRSQIGSGERSEKIRTYNFPQGRVSDHRIGLTIYQVDDVMAGRLDLVIEPLIAHFRAEALKSGGDAAGF